jgi:hypothetical protein
MKEMPRSTGIANISQFDSMLAINGGGEPQLSITLSTRQIVGIGDLIAIWPRDPDNWIEIRTQSSSKHFHAHRLASR